LPGRPNSQAAAPSSPLPGSSDAAESHRATGFHGDFPEQDFAELRHQRLDEVGLANRDAAAADHHVGSSGRLPEGRLEQRRLVANDPEIEDFATHTAEHAEKRVAVAVIDFATAQRRTDRAQFVAGREKGDAQTAVDADLGTTQRGDQTEFRRADQSSGSERRLAGGEVFAGAADVLAAALPGGITTLSPATARRLPASPPHRYRPAAAHRS
jgi:hypothetical protein